MGAVSLNSVVAQENFNSVELFAPKTGEDDVSSTQINEPDNAFWESVRKEEMMRMAAASKKETVQEDPEEDDEDEKAATPYINLVSLRYDMIAQDISDESIRPDSILPDGNTPISLAFQWNDTRLVDALMTRTSKAGLGVKLPGGMTPALYLAQDAGRQIFFRFALQNRELIAKGRNENGQNALMLFLMRKNAASEKEIFQWLLNSGIDITQKDKAGLNIMSYIFSARQWSFFDAIIEKYGTGKVQELFGKEYIQDKILSYMTSDMYKKYSTFISPEKQYELNQRINFL